MAKMTEHAKLIRDAKRTGYNARRWLAKGRSENPYAVGTALREAWNDGFNQAAKDDAESQDADAAREIGRYGETDDDDAD